MAVRVVKPNLNAAVGASTGAALNLYSGCNQDVMGLTRIFHLEGEVVSQPRLHLIGIEPATWRGAP